jgi:hypothetical protein
LDIQVGKNEKNIITRLRMADIIMEVDIYLANKKNLVGIKVGIQVGFQVNIQVDINKIVASHLLVGMRV